MKKLILGLLLSLTALSAEDIYATFSVEAGQNASLAFSSSGIVQKLSADVTSEVKEDEVLAEIQNADLKASLAVAKTALKFAKIDYDRQLKVKHLIDKSKLDSFAFKYENAKAQVAYQQALLDKTILKAPFDGVIYEKRLEVGDVVSGQMITIVYKIQSLHARKLIVEFDQAYHNKVHVGDMFQYTIDGDTHTYEGQITKIYPYANTQTRKIKAEVKAQDIMVGLFGDGTIISSVK